MSSVPSAYDADELGQYRSLSTPAVISLLLGLCSGVVFVHPLLVIVPLAAIALGILALQSIAKSEGGLTGGRLAYCGVALAIIFAVGSFVRLKVRDVILLNQADHTAQQWLAYASKGQAEEMLEWTSQAAVQRISPSAEPGTPPSYFSGVLAGALLRNDPYVVSLQQQREKGELNLAIADKTIRVSEKAPPEAFFHYTAVGADAEQASYVVKLKRFRLSAEDYIWLVDSWVLD